MSTEKSQKIAKTFRGFSSRHPGAFSLSADIHHSGNRLKNPFAYRTKNRPVFLRKRSGKCSRLSRHHHNAILKVRFLVLLQKAPRFFAKYRAAVGISGGCAHFPSSNLISASVLLQIHIVEIVDHRLNRTIGCLQTLCRFHVRTIQQAEQIRLDRSRIVIP